MTAAPEELPLAEYRESSPGLRRHFKLYPSKITVNGWRLGGDEFESHLSLEQLSPDIGLLYFRNRLLRAGVLLFFGFLGVAWFLGVALRPAGDAAFTPGVFFALGISLTGLALAAIFYPKCRAYRIANRTGLIVIDVIEAGPDKGGCKSFVEKIQATIRAAAPSMSSDPNRCRG